MASDRSHKGRTAACQQKAIAGLDPHRIRLAYNRHPTRALRHGAGLDPFMSGMHVALVHEKSSIVDIVENCAAMLRCSRGCHVHRGRCRWLPRRGRRTRLFILKIGDVSIELRI